MASQQQKDNRVRNYATIVYPESAKENWQSLLSNLHIKAFVSPLHDKDKYNDGTDKKPHWHVMLMYGGKKSFKQVQDDISIFGGVGCEVVQDLKGYGRYLCHLDEKEKVHYNPQDVKEFSGAVYSEISRNKNDDFKDLKDLFNYIVDNTITRYSNLINMLIADNEDSLFKIAIDKAYVVNSYLMSYRYDKIRHPYERTGIFNGKLVDTKTGEIILDNVEYED